MSQRLLLADIGGTNARFALAADGEIRESRTVDTAGLTTLAPIIEELGFEWGRFDAAYLAVAGPVEGGRATLTNGALSIDGQALARAAGLPRICLLNDFEGLAWSLPVLTDDDRRLLGGGSPRPDAPIAVLGPGTGLGVAAWLPAGAVVAGEGGHVSLPARDETEEAIVAHLRERFGHVSAERVLSGPGLQNLYRAITGGSPPPSHEITAAAGAGDEQAGEVIAAFCRFLGTVASDVALSFGARGGLYLTGGVLSHMEELLAASGFHDRFTDKGRFGSYLAAVPVYLLTASGAAFRGLINRAAHDGP